jgi:hypothetical protein
LHARLGIERSGVQIPVEATHLFLIFLSQINIELNISVATSLIANLLQLKHWKALVALYENKLVYNLTTFTLPKQIQRLLCFDFLEQINLFLVIVCQLIYLYQNLL